jgi:hypothetical protein
VLVHQIQDPWHTFACAVFIERVLSQIQESVQNRFGDGSSGAADRLTPASNCMDTVTAKRAPSGQKASVSVMVVASQVMGDPSNFRQSRSFLGGFMG